MTSIFNVYLIQNENEIPLATRVSHQFKQCGLRLPLLSLFVVYVVVAVVSHLDVSNLEVENLVEVRAFRVFFPFSHVIFFIQQQIEEMKEEEKYTKRG